MGMFGSMGAVNSALLNKASKYGTSEMAEYVPEYKSVTAGDVSKSATTGTLANWDDTVKVTKAANLLGDEELKAGMERISPGITATMAQALKTTQSWLRGEVPQDVQNSLINAGAASGVEGGFAGSTFGRNVTARDLGLTSLNLIQSGMTAAERWTSMVANMTPQYNYGNLMINSSQALQMAEYNNSNQWNVDWLKGQIESLGSRTDQAWNNMFISVGNTADSLSMAAATKGMGSSTDTPTGTGWGKSMPDGTV